MQLFYTVRAGDTLSNIAMRWHIPIKSLIEANNLEAPNAIFPGQQLSMPPGVNTYVVKPGDSAYSISLKYGVPVRRIIEDNGLELPYTIMPGEVLTVQPGGRLYIVQPGDTLYKIAGKYNVTVNGQPVPELIIEENEGLTADILPGMTIIVPYPPPGGSGKLAVILYDGVKNFIGIYEPLTGSLNSIAIGDADSATRLFWSPNQSSIAYIGSSGVINIIDVATKKLLKIDQIPLPGFIDWADSSRIVYSNGRVIRIYDISSNTYKNIYRAGASYVQWFPGGTELLFEARDTSGTSQLYRIKTDGSDERQITENNNGLLNEVRLSPNGRFVLYTSPGVSISEIYTLELSTGIINKIPGGPEAKNYYPAWSPDSTRIAYSATQFINGKYYSLIRVTGLRGEGDATLAIASCYATPVTWSADGTRIAYLSGCRQDNPPVGVWSIDIRKLVPVNVLEGYIFYNLDWSPGR